MEYQIKPVVGFPGYFVSTCGEVWSEIKGDRRQMRPTLARGYHKVGFTIKGKSNLRLVHRLVLEAFVGPAPEGHGTRHLNGVRNDNRIENLAWGTPQENISDKKVHGTDPVGERHGGAKLTERDVYKIRSATIPKMILKDIFGISKSHLDTVLRGKLWAHL